MTALDLRDSDLWFHLNQGREFFKTGSIPTTSFFSYIDPVRHWVNYAWLFQAISYQIFIHSGYVGLIVLRSLVFAAMGCVLYLLVARNRPYNTLAILVALLCFVGLISRGILVRPHIITYLLILLTIFVFEKKRHFWLLPVLFLLEANIHGIVYPILLLVWGSYLFEYYLDYKRGIPLNVSGKNILLAGLAPVFLLANPFGVHLFPLPFENAESFVKYYIVEMRAPWFGGRVFLFLDVFARFSVRISFACYFYRHNCHHLFFV